MDTNLTAVLKSVSPAGGGGFVAYAEQLPGAIWEGDTVDVARENLRDSIVLLLEANRELEAKRSPGKQGRRLHGKRPEFL